MQQYSALWIHAQQLPPFYPKQAKGQGHLLKYANMEPNNENREIEKILKFSNTELTGNWSKLASLIRIYEQTDWAFAKRKASELLSEKWAVNYIETVRQYPDGKIQATAKPASLPATIPQIIPDRKSRSKKNYDRLLKIAPDIELKLRYAVEGDEISGSSDVTGYRNFHVEMIRKDTKGYYLTLAHYQAGDEMIPDPAMTVFISIHKQSVEALSFENPMGYREVYNDMFERTMVNTAERKAQNIYLGKWLKELRDQRHRIEWKAEFTTGMLPKGYTEEPIPETETVTDQEEQEQELETAKSREDFQKYVQEMTVNRQKSKPTTREVIKSNYSLLTEFMPDLITRLKYRHSKGSIYLSVSTDESAEYRIIRARELNSEVLQFILRENQKDKEIDLQGMVLIAVDLVNFTAGISILANNFMGQEDFRSEQHEANSQIIYNANSQLKQWLESLSFHDYKPVWDNEPEESEIPDFEPGNVMLTTAHQREGVTQKDIDWINHHRQGMVFIPRRKPESENLLTLISVQASKTGFRMCSRGKLYYTGRSNRNTGLQQG